MLTAMQRVVLQHVAETEAGALRKHKIDIRSVSENYRQRAIDLGMMEPPLIDIDGDYLFITEAGRRALQSEERDNG